MPAPANPPRPRRDVNLGLVLGCTVLGLCWVALGYWLMQRTGWPRAFPFEHPRRGSLIADLAHSRLLLDRGWPELALFAWLWTMAALPILVLALLSRARRPGAALPSSPTE